MPGGFQWQPLNFDCWRWKVSTVATMQSRRPKLCRTTRRIQSLRDFAGMAVRFTECLILLTSACKGTAWQLSKPVWLCWRISRPQKCLLPAMVVMPNKDHDAPRAQFFAKHGRPPVHVLSIIGLLNPSSTRGMRSRLRIRDALGTEATESSRVNVQPHLHVAKKSVVCETIFL